MPPPESVIAENDDQLGAAVSQVAPVRVVSARSTCVLETPDSPSFAVVVICTE